uniref:Uncharacterized protein n=1 Tax=Acrobeloides nanus TaxID=290746 RepID=A0A914C9F6_9BILA
MANSDSGAPGVDYVDEVLVLASLNINQMRIALETNGRSLYAISVLSKLRGGRNEIQAEMEIWREGDRGIDGEPINLQSQIVSHQAFESFIMERTHAKNIQRRSNQPPRRPFSPVREGREFHIKGKLRDAQGNSEKVHVVYTAAHGFELGRRL